MDKNICEENVFSSIFMEYSEKLRNFIYYKSGNISLSEDMVQESFVKLWENCAKIEFLKAKSFLYTVATNLFINHVNHEKVVLKFRKKSPSISDAQNPEFIMEENEFRDRLEQAINSLPEKQRVVFLMNRIDKLKLLLNKSLLNIKMWCFGCHFIGKRIRFTSK